jgi:hypothetical protein
MNTADRKKNEKLAGFITANLIDIEKRWLPIQEYEESGKERTSLKMKGK